jgi:hypothetical protein
VCWSTARARRRASSIVNGYAGAVKFHLRHYRRRGKSELKMTFEQAVVSWCHEPPPKPDRVATPTPSPRRCRSLSAMLIQSKPARCLSPANCDRCWRCSGTAAMT